MGSLLTLKFQIIFKEAHLAIFFQINNYFVIHNSATVRWASFKYGSARWQLTSKNTLILRLDNEIAFFAMRESNVIRVCRASWLSF